MKTINKLPISVVILTFNEERNLDACLKSVYNWADEIFIVDSYSTDRTLKIAKKYAGKIFQNRFETHSKQWIWALDKLPIKNDWVLGLDADQRITEKLSEEIIDKWEKGFFGKSDGFYIKRRQIFMGQWIKHGTYYPRYLLKLFRRSRVYINSNELMDHHFYLSSNVNKLNYDLIEENIKENDLSFWIKKHKKYALLQAAEQLTGHKPNKKQLNQWTSLDARRLWIKQNIWNRLPLFIRPCIYYIYRYFIKGGFLDGIAGLKFHFLQGFWYRIQVDLKIYQLQKAAKRKNLNIKSLIKDKYGLEL